MKSFLCIALYCVSTFSVSTARAVDLGDIEKHLSSDGVVGWIHGDVPSLGLYVFTYRDPKNFFDYIEMSLVAPNSALKTQLATFSRHDQIRIKGVFLDNPSPQKHISLTSIELIKKFENPYPTDPYGHEAKIPDDLQNLTSATFLVHAIASDGHILVVEYKDAVLPIYVKNADLTKSLFRNDVVKLAFSQQVSPSHPTHLELTESAAKPVEVIDSIQTKNGKPGVIEGALIMFPQSPEIIFNVFAVQEILPDGLKRQYTLVNFDSPEEFTKIRTALQTAWDKIPNHYINGRNKLLSQKITVKATGMFNEVDPGQANPQILLKSVNDLEITFH